MQFPCRVTYYYQRVSRHFLTVLIARVPLPARGGGGPVAANRRAPVLTPRPQEYKPYVRIPQLKTKGGYSADIVRTYIPGDICPHNVRTMSAQCPHYVRTTSPKGDLYP